MEDSEIMQWQPVRIASAQHTLSRHQTGVFLDPDYDSMVGMIVKVRPLKGTFCAICCGRSYEIHDADLARNGLLNGYLCEHQFLAD